MVHRFIAELREQGVSLPDDEVSVSVRQAPPEKEWREAYKRYFKVARLSRQIVVVPSWETFTPAPDDRVLHLDPGQAFGTGSHATTTLVLGELQQLADEGRNFQTVLDAGTGSGILIIAVAKLLPMTSRWAFDNDILAVDATRENCAHNDVEAVVERRDAPDTKRVGAFDLIVANIQRHVLLDFVESLTTVSATTSTLILSGLLSYQLDEVSAAYARLGWSESKRRLAEPEPQPKGDNSQWGVLVLERGPVDSR